MKNKDIKNEEMKYAGFWTRLLALVIDGMIIGIPVWFVQSIITFSYVLPKMNGLATMLDNGEIQTVDEFHSKLVSFELTFVLISLLVMAAANIMYFALMESSKKQATIGKLILGIQVIGESKERISFKRAVGRTFARILSGIPFGAGYLMVGFHSEKKSLHDLLARTYVVKKI